MKRIAMEGTLYVSTSEICRDIGLTVSSDRLRNLGFHPQRAGATLLWRVDDLGKMYAALATELVRKAEARR